MLLCSTQVLAVSASKFASSTMLHRDSIDGEFDNSCTCNCQGSQRECLRSMINVLSNFPSAAMRDKETVSPFCTSVTCRDVGRISPTFRTESSAPRSAMRGEERINLNLRNIELTVICMHEPCNFNSYTVCGKSYSFKLQKGPAGFHTVLRIKINEKLYREVWDAIWYQYYIEK